MIEVPQERRDHLLQLREETFADWEEAEKHLAELRVRIERQESDIRIGLPEPSDYAELKGHTFPQAEARVVECYRTLLKLEERLTGAI